MMNLRLQANVHIDLRKFILYNVIEFAFWFYLCLSYLTLLGRYNIEVAHTAAFIPSVFFMVKNWRYFYKKKNFRIYDTGIDFDKLGFWEWKDIGYKRKVLNKHQFTLDYTGRELTKAQLKRSKHKYIDTNGNNIMLLLYGYPPISASISNNDITKLIYKMMGNKVQEKIPLQTAGHYATWSFISILVGMLLFFAVTGTQAIDHAYVVTGVIFGVPILVYTYANKKIKNER